MTTNGKRSVKAREGIDREKLYPLDEAVKMVKDRATAKFDETIEIAMNLGVDPRHADQMVRGVVALPNGTGRTTRVAVFARGAKADEARAAGADVVGAEDLVEKVNAGNIDFDRVFRGLAKAGYEGPITFESFSSAVVNKQLSGILGIWRNLWEDGADLARHAKGFIEHGLKAAREAQQRSASTH